MDREIFRKPARLCNPRNETQMFLFQGAPESAGNKKIIARLAAPARYPAFSFNESNNACRDGNRPWCAACFAADDADLEPLRRPTQAEIKFFHPRDFGLFRGHKRDQSELGHG